MAKKDQFVIAYLTDLTDTDTVVSHAAFFAQRLNKGLILLHISDPRYTKVTPDEAERDLKKICDTQTLKHSSTQAFTYVALSGETKQVLSSLPTLLNAVLVVAQVDAKAGRKKPTNLRNVLRNFADCRAAFLTVQKPINGISAPTNFQFSIFNFQLNNVAMVVDFKKESKDKFIWSSYFPRFIGSQMHVLYYDYKDQFLHSKWYANMTQLHKLYSGLNLTFTPHIIPAKSTFLDINALRYADQSRYGMLIAVTTKEKDGLEFFIGVQEERTIVNKAHIPILFLNPREELYVLCD